MRSINTGCTHCPSPADGTSPTRMAFAPCAWLACAPCWAGWSATTFRGTWLVTTPPAPVPAETVTA